jgi:hypothetical protein
MANVLVVLDEAHRHAPSTRGLEGYPAILLNLLRRAARETRKYGIGWMFISQTLGGLDTEILQQMRVHFFGFGLALGDEFRKLKEFAGGDDRAMELYNSFRDPQAFPSKEQREFPFMAAALCHRSRFRGSPCSSPRLPTRRPSCLQTASPAVVDADQAGRRRVRGDHLLLSESIDQGVVAPAKPLALLEERTHTLCSDAGERRKP